MGSEQIRLEIVKALIAAGELNEGAQVARPMADLQKVRDSRIERVRQKVDALEKIVTRCELEDQRRTVHSPGTSPCENAGRC